MSDEKNERYLKGSEIDLLVQIHLESGETNYVTIQKDVRRQAGLGLVDSIRTTNAVIREGLASINPSIRELHEPMRGQLTRFENLINRHRR